MMLKPVIPNSLILPPSAITSVSSAADIFFTLLETSTMAPPLLCLSETKYLTEVTGFAEECKKYFLLKRRSPKVLFNILRQSIEAISSAK